MWKFNHNGLTVLKISALKILSLEVSVNLNIPGHHFVKIHETI